MHFHFEKINLKKCNETSPWCTLQPGKTFMTCVPSFSAALSKHLELSDRLLLL